MATLLPPAKPIYGRKGGIPQAAWWPLSINIGNGRHLKGRELERYKKTYEERDRQERLRKEGQREG